MLIKQINASLHSMSLSLISSEVKKKKSQIKKKNAFAKEVRHWFLKQSPGTVIFLFLLFTVNTNTDTGLRAMESKASQVLQAPLC